MRYLLDSNAFIQAKSHCYRMSVFPGFWDWIDLNFKSGSIGSIAEVYKEIANGNDELVPWAKDRSEFFISNNDKTTQASVAEIAEYLFSGNFNAKSRDNFLAKADPWLIAKARTLGAAVVTHESRVTPEAKQVKIPNICKQFEVRCLNMFDLLQEMEATFILSP